MSNKFTKPLGVVPPGAIQFQSENGDVINETDAVFPIITAVEGEIQIIGTGFYISRNGIFVTAAHCLTDSYGKFQSSQSFQIVHSLPNNQYIFRPTLRAWKSDFADVAIAVAAPVTHDKTGKPLANDVISLTLERPPVGSNVISYGYGGSNIEKEGKSTKLKFQRGFYDGKLLDYFPNGRDRSTITWPVWETDIHIHAGASGGPVVSDRGTAFAINTSSLDGMTDVSYITPIDFILDGIIDSVQMVNGEPEKSTTIRELAKSGHISFTPAFPTRD